MLTTRISIWTTHTSLYLLSTYFEHWGVAADELPVEHIRRIVSLFDVRETNSGAGLRQASRRITVRMAASDGSFG